jgi:hypothetical protein
MVSGDTRRAQWRKLRELQKGLGSRQVTSVVHDSDSQGLKFENSHEWEKGKAPELHVTVREGEAPLVVWVREECYAWRRADGIECTCPTSFLSWVVERVIATVNTS